MSRQTVGATYYLLLGLILAHKAYFWAPGRFANSYDYFHDENFAEGHAHLTTPPYGFRHNESPFRFTHLSYQFNRQVGKNNSLKQT